MPAIGGATFVITMLGIIWLILWRGRMRLWGGVAAAIGVVLIILTPAADILVTADGRHVAIRTPQGGYALLRARAGDYVRDQLAESAGYEGDFADLATLPSARCSADMCAVDVARDNGQSPIRLLATRSGYRLPWQELVNACAQADIVIADRFLPRGCTPRWLKLDTKALAPMGGALILIEDRHVIAGKDPCDQHPWATRRGRLGARGF